MRSIFFYFILLFYGNNLFAQNIEPRKIINEICSEKYYGRGYTNNGDKKTVKYIVDKLKKYGLKSFTKDYLQLFSINVNTFSSDMDLFIDDSVFTPGKDFLVNPKSNSCKGTYEIIFLNHEDLKNKKYLQIEFTNKFVIIDTIGMNDKSFKKIYQEIINKNVLNAKGYIEISEKIPMFGISQSVYEHTIIQIVRSKMPKTTKLLKINIKNKYLENYSTQNVAGYIEGITDTFIVYTAHYDHLGQLGKSCFFPGANDNGSGIAMLLNLASYYSVNKPKYSIAFIFFSAEEIGLLGSQFYCENPLFPLSKIKFLLNLDVIGSGDKGIQIVNSTIFKKEFDLLFNINENKKYFNKIHKRGAAANSDHYFFYEKGVPSFFIYTLGDYKEYHNIYDSQENVPLNKFKELYNLLIDFTEIYK